MKRINYVIEVMDGFGIMSSDEWVLARVTPGREAHGKRWPTERAKPLVTMAGKTIEEALAGACAYIMNKEGEAIPEVEVLDECS